MDLTQRREDFGTDDQSWLGSRHGINNASSVTLNTAAFTKETHYPNGRFKSGIVLTKNGNVYEPWATGNDVAGILLTDLKAPEDPATNVVGAMLEHCRVVTSKLVNPPDAAGQATAPMINFA